jgi:DNA-binding transcriptional regulator YhcF (GntR family)
MNKYEVLEQVYKSNLPSRAKQVMFYLINRANGEGTCFPSIKTTASDCGVSTRTIQRTMKVLLETGFIKKNSRFREKGGQTSNFYTVECPSENNEDDCKKEIIKEEVKVAEKQKIDTCEKIEIVNFSDYQTSDYNRNETIENELLGENKEVISNIPEATYKGGNSFIPTKCHSIFMQSNSAFDKINYKDSMINIQCHGEGDNLYPP